MVQRKHELHEETLAKCIKDLQDVIERYAGDNSPEALYSHVKTTSAAVLFLLQERKRDRDKRGGDYSRPANILPPIGVDLLKT
jgi:hypothetical protein